MKNLIITFAVLILSLASFAQSKKTVVIEKSFPPYEDFGRFYKPSNEQVKSTDSLKKIGFKPVSVRASNGKLIVRFIKAA